MSNVHTASLKFESQSLLENPYFIFLVYCLVGFAIYSNTLNAPFIFDDEYNIKSPALRIEEISVKEVQEAVTRGALKTRPISNFSFALNYYISGYSLPELHLVNIYIHIFTAILFFLFLRLTLQLSLKKNELNKSNFLAFSCAILWLVHPLATQSVTYLIQRMNSLAAMFYILSMVFYCYGRISHDKNKQKSNFSKKWLWFLASGSSGAMAVGSKEVAVTLPIMIFIYEWYFFQSLNLQWLKRKVPFILLILILMGGATFIVLDGDFSQLLYGYGRRTFTLGERLLTQSRVVLHYMSLIIYPNPSRLVFDYNFPISTSLISPISTLISLAFISGSVLVAALFAQKDRLISFCILWFLVNLIVESSFIPLEMVFEHRTYLPSMFFIVLCVVCVFRLCSRSKVFFVGIMFLTITFSFWTYQRNIVWQDPVGFWLDSITKYPGKARTHVNLGKSYTDQGDFDLAEVHTQISLKLDPSHPVANRNMGQLLLYRNELGSAEKYLLQAIKSAPNFVDAHLDLATIYERRNMHKEAIDRVGIVLKFASNSLRANKMMGMFLVRGGEYAKGASYLKEVLKNHPKEADVHLLLGESFLGVGNMDDALSEFKKTLKINPDQAEAHYNSAKILSSQGRDVEALFHYQKAAYLDQNSADGWYNLANVLLRLGKLDEAEVAYKKSLEHTIEIADVWNNLGLIYVEKENYSEALRSFNNSLSFNKNHVMAKRNRILIEEIISDKQAD